MLSLGALALAACANTAIYRPARVEGAIGYTDKALSRGHYLVTFTGTQNMDLEEVRQYLRRREAEVTLREGYSNFVVFTTRNEADIRVLPAADYWNPENGFLAGYINKDSSRANTREPGAPVRPWVGDSSKTTRYTAFSEIVVLSDMEAAKNPDAQSAHEILDRLARQSAP